VLRSHGDARGDIFPIGRPDADDLEWFMFSSDAPYQHRRLANDGRIEIVAKGHSAVCLLVWLDDLVKAATAYSRAQLR
jgi:hypothetical protein